MSRHVGPPGAPRPTSPALSPGRSCRVSGETCHSQAGVGSGGWQALPS